MLANMQKCYVPKEKRESDKKPVKNEQKQSKPAKEETASQDVQPVKKSRQYILSPEPESEPEKQREPRKVKTEQMLAAMEMVALSSFVKFETAGDFYDRLSMIRKEETDIRTWGKHRAKLEKKYSEIEHFKCGDALPPNICPGMIADYLKHYAAEYSQEGIDNYVGKWPAEKSQEALARVVLARLLILNQVVILARYHKLYKDNVVKTVKLIPVDIFCRQNVLRLAALDLNMKKPIIKQYALAYLDLEVPASWDSLKNWLGLDYESPRKTQRSDYEKTLNILQNYSFDAYRQTREFSFDYDKELFIIKMPNELLGVFLAKFQASFQDVSTAKAGNALQVSFRSSDRREVYAMLSFLGPEVMLLQPEEVLREYGQRLQKTLEQMPRPV